MLRNVDNLIGYIEDRLKQEGLYDDMNIVITSDHGIDTVAAVNIIDLTKFLDPDTFEMHGTSPLFIQTLKKCDFLMVNFKKS